MNFSHKFFYVFVVVFIICSVQNICYANSATRRGRGLSRGNSTQKVCCLSKEDIAYLEEVVSSRTKVLIVFAFLATAITLVGFICWFFSRTFFNPFIDIAMLFWFILYLIGPFYLYPIYKPLEQGYTLQWKGYDCPKFSPEN